MSHRVQLTVRLEPQVMQAAKQRSGETKESLSTTVAEAAKESLLSSYRSEREQEILKAVDRNFYFLRRLERQLRLDMAVLKEMIGLHMRSFFNHTTPIPEATKNAALRSGKERFARYLDLLAANLRSGESILRDVPLPEPEVPPASPSSPESIEEISTTSSRTHAAPNRHSATQGTPAHAGAHSASHSTARTRQHHGLFDQDRDRH